MGRKSCGWSTRRLSVVLDNGYHSLSPNEDSKGVECQGLGNLMKAEWGCGSRLKVR